MDRPPMSSPVKKKMQTDHAEDSSKKGPLFGLWSHRHPTMSTAHPERSILRLPRRETAISSVTTMTSAASPRRTFFPSSSSAPGASLAVTSWQMEQGQHLPPRCPGQRSVPSRRLPGDVGPGGGRPSTTGRRGPQSKKDLGPETSRT